MKTKESIRKKWEVKVEQMKRKADFKYEILLQNRKKVYEVGWEHEIEKVERKKAAYIRKKEEEYKRRMLNEIREMEHRPKKVYKSEWPKIKPLEFAMELAQENARLRDTDEDGKWRCISCNKMCDWSGLAWGHRYSRRFTNMCLEEENINAQCHTCNFTTWPRGDTVAKQRTNDEYDKNIEIKFWKWTVQKLKDKVYEFTHNKNAKYDLKRKIPVLINRNEKLWKTKNFYAPKRKWRQIWEEYDKRH